MNKFIQYFLFLVTLCYASACLSMDALQQDASNVQDSTTQVVQEVLDH